VILLRTVAYASLFIGLLLVFLPGRILELSGVIRPETIGPIQWLGVTLVVLGGTLAVWCILTFVFAGRGTPAPFDPPRRLVVRGPYRVVRNPMYLGATILLAGVAAYYQSLPILAYAAAFVIATHLFVVAYEEPALRRGFGIEYEEYCRRVSRWWPLRNWGGDRRAKRGPSGSSEASPHDR
jgi:protein-S-isoprenylcysteine O-methyltransferase Ste14